MTFIADRFQSAASWILNPRLFWLGRDLQEFLQVTAPAQPTWRYRYNSFQPREVLSEATQQRIEKITPQLTNLSLRPPTNLWQQIADDISINNTLPKFTGLRSPKPTSWLYRNLYSDEFRRAWITTDTVMSNLPVEDNLPYAKFIVDTISKGDKYGRYGKNFSITSNNFEQIIITSLPDFIISRSRLKGSISVENESIYNNNGLADVFDMSVHPSQQSATHDLIPRTMLNPDWLYSLGWYDLWAGPRSVHNPSGVANQHDCNFCSAGTVFCPDCEEGYNECGECGGSHYWDCEDCNGGYIECQSCDGDGTQLCDDCDGEGSVDCTMCENEGTNDCEACNGTASLTECPDCEGTGWEGGSANEAQDNECEECAGEGETSPYDCPSCEEGQVECEYGCNEAGQVDCDNCEGEGQITCSECDGDGGSYCERYECNDGVIYCEYCEEGYQECSECEGHYEQGSCPQKVYEEVWGESIDSSLLQLVTRNGRENKLQTLMSLVRPLPLKDSTLNPVTEVYGDLKFDFLTMKQIWNRFLKVMKQQKSEALYFFNPVRSGVVIQYATAQSCEDDIQYTLGQLKLENRRTIESWSEGNEQQISNVKTRTGENVKDRQIALQRYSYETPASSRRYTSVAGEPQGNSFLSIFDIQVDPADLVYWQAFWTRYRDFLRPLQYLATSSNISIAALAPALDSKQIKEFKFVLGSSAQVSSIISLNYPKG
jgi:hypothetical protein